MTKKKHGLAIVGGSGYGAGEILRLLVAHPHIEVCGVTSRSHVGKSISTIHSHLQGVVDIQFSEHVDLEQLGRYEAGSAIILAMPSGHAVQTVRTLIAQGLPQRCVVVDLSGDLRLTEQSVHEAFYKEAPFEADMRCRFTYGLSELAPDAISKAAFVTNPGCLATASILALAPVAKANLKGSVVVDAKTGTSGAGREPQSSMHHPSRTADFTAYKVLEHRHEPEILQALGPEFSRNHSFMFVPHLLPSSRGIFVTAYVSLDSAEAAQSVKESYSSLYHQQPFIRMRQSPPRLVDVIGTNFCDISVVARGCQLVIMAAIDNLGKGMAGQAIQNLNLAFGLPQETGLLFPALGPV
jgi:N-acetyl-gamma-glutamyl-phosphate reductase common form